MNLLLLVGGSAAAFLAIDYLRYHPFALFFLVSAPALIIWDVPRFAPVASLAGITIYPQDAVTITVLALSSLAGRSNFKHRFTPMFLSLAIFLALSLITGVASSGLAAAVNESRSVLWFVVLLVWAASIKYTDVEQVRIERGMSFLGWAMVLVGVYHLALVGLGGAGVARQLSDGSNATSRILVSGQAIILVACFATELHRHLRKPRITSAVSATTFAAIVVLAQNRSTWVALMAVIAVTFLTSNRETIWQLIRYLQGLAIVVLLAVGLGLLGDLTQSLADSASDTRTLDSRTTGWSELLGEQFKSGPIQVLFGQPFGTGFERRDINGQMVTFAPHNWYVLLLLRIGILGLLVYIALIATVMARLIRNKATAGAAMWAALLVYGWFYSLEWYMAPIAGLCIAQALARFGDAKDSTVPLHEKPRSFVV